MNCRQITKLISAYLDSEITGSEMISVRRHISDCSHCNGEFENTRQIKLSLARLSTAQPRADFLSDIIMRLDEVSLSPYERIANGFSAYMQVKFSPVRTALVAAGLALVVLSAGSVDVDRSNISHGEVMASAPLGIRTSDTSFASLSDRLLSYTSRPLDTLGVSSEPSSQQFRFAAFQAK